MRRPRLGRPREDGADHQRRIIGYFTGRRTGKGGTPAYLACDIRWDKVTHIDYAFAHADGADRISVGTDGAANPVTGMTWPGVTGAEIDPAYACKGHSNLLGTFRKQHPDVKTPISVGGWAETGTHAHAHRRHVHRARLERRFGPRERRHRLPQGPLVEGQVVDDGRGARHHR